MPGVLNVYRVVGGVYGFLCLTLVRSGSAVPWFGDLLLPAVGPVDFWHLFLGVVELVPSHVLECAHWSVVSVVFFMFPGCPRVGVDFHAGPVSSLLGVLLSCFLVPLLLCILDTLLLDTKSCVSALYFAMAVESVSPP